MEAVSLWIEENKSSFTGVVCGPIMTEVLFWFILHLLDSSHCKYSGQGRTLSFSRKKWINLGRNKEKCVWCVRGGMVLKSGPHRIKQKVRQQKWPFLEFWEILKYGISLQPIDVHTQIDFRLCVQTPDNNITGETRGTCLSPTTIADEGLREFTCCAYMCCGCVHVWVCVYMLVCGCVNFYGYLLYVCGRLKLIE